MKYFDFMRIKLFLLIMALCILMPAAGQEMEAFVPQGYSLIPPAPEAAALMSYIETPVGATESRLHI